MYDHSTGLWQDQHLPFEEQLIDGYGKREPETQWNEDFINFMSDRLYHEEIIEDQL